MEIRTLDSLSLRELTAAFNLAFSDYSVKMELSEARMAYKISMENIRLHQSFGMFAGDVLAGFVLQAREEGGHEVYNAGTGVMPAYRGNSITKRLYAFMIPYWKQQGIVNHRLEVIIGNQPAIHTYEALGFQTTRTLACFRGHVQAAPAPGVVTTISSIGTDLHFFASYRDISPSWQNSNAFVERLGEDLVWIKAWVDGVIVGYLVMDKDSAKVHQFGVYPPLRRQGLGRTLFHAAQAQLSGQQALTVLNVDTQAPATLNFLKAIGLTNFIDQYEMHLQVK